MFLREFNAPIHSELFAFSQKKYLKTYFINFRLLFHNAIYNFNNYKLFFMINKYN